MREYLLYDQGRTFIQEGIRAWRLVDGRYQPWLPNTAGRWQSETIGVAFVLEEDMIAVYTSDGRRMLREGEVEAERARYEAEHARYETERARYEDEIARLHRLLAERSE